MPHASVRNGLFSGRTGNQCEILILDLLLFGGGLMGIYGTSDLYLFLIPHTTDNHIWMLNSGNLIFSYSQLKIFIITYYLQSLKSFWLWQCWPESSCRVWCWNLRNRCKWSDRSAHEHQWCRRYSNFPNIETFFHHQGILGGHFWNKPKESGC